MSKVKLKGRTFSVPNITRLVHYSQYETLFFLGPPKATKKYTICLGVGIVKVIQKGKDFDMVGMDFGRGFAREIYVKNNHARRQIATLKKGQYAWFYGTLRSYQDDGQWNTSLFAKAFQGWYVPKVMDIINIDPNEVEELTEENESKIDFIDKLISGDEEL